MGLMMPVRSARMSSWTAHQYRNPPSTEPGTDFYCPIGTPVYAPEDGRVYGYGTSIIPATGRWVGLDLTNGMRFRAMHFSSIALSSTTLNNGGFVRKGDIIAYSGASGYGEDDWSWNPDTGGAHCHATLWPTQQSLFGYHWVNGVKVPYTVDIMDYITDSAGGGSSVIPIVPEGDKMNFLFVNDNVDGNNLPGWAVVNPSANIGANNPVTLRSDAPNAQNIANSWARSMGKSADTCNRQDMLNLMALVKLTRGQG